jgi:hypothetical protein
MKNELCVVDLKSTCYMKVDSGDKQDDAIEL